MGLFLKIVLPVLVIGAATLVSHRWGPAVGGIVAAGAPAPPPSFAAKTTW